MRAGSLFSGCGGLDLAVEKALGAAPAWLCEADPHCRTVLERHWPGVPLIGDVREIDAGVGAVDVLHGGYPCQPFSVAGRRLGEQDPRHLWPEFHRLLRVLRPRLAVLENVSGHLALGFGAVQRDLAEVGYDAAWGCVRASDAGAPHRRERLFVIATDTSSTGAGRNGASALGSQEPDRRGEPSDPDPPGVHRSLAADPGSERPHGRPQRGGSGRWPRSEGGRTAAANPGCGRRGERAELHGRTDEDAAVGRGWVMEREGPREPQRSGVSWGVYEPGIRRWEAVRGDTAPRPVDDRGRLVPEFVEWMMGFPLGWTDGAKRTHRLRMLGNAVVPQQGALALRLLTGQL